MDIKITILPECDSVFLLSGEFFEGGQFKIESETVIYLTVMPLDARFMPYTVKLMGAKPVGNEALAASCKISEDEYVIKTGKRYSFIYSELHKNEPEDAVARFFYYVKGGHFDFAREMMSEELASSLGDESLRSFFDGFDEIFPVRGEYYLSDTSGVGHKTVFSFKDGLIDNISVD